MNEIYKPVKGYEGLYEVSNLGNVKSLEREVRNGPDSTRLVREKVLAPRIKKNGYYQVSLCSDLKCKNKHVHSLVAIAFKNHTPGKGLVVNHKDFNRQNNNLANLELITQRANTDQKHLPSASKYTGVIPVANRFRAYIKHAGRTKHIGVYDSEEEASAAYEKYLTQIN